MKKSYLIMAAIASLALVSCSDEEFVGNPELGPGQGKTAEIVFGSVGKGMTRADLTGEAAAEKLNYKFVFAGTKTQNNNYVFDQYTAEWTTNTANTTESNSNDWEYVGKTLATTTSLPAGATQSIKYWDYSTSQYDFAAYSLGLGALIDHDNNPSTADVMTPASATPITFADINDGDPGSYTLTGTAEQLKSCYISDLVTMYNKIAVEDDQSTTEDETSPAANDYGNVVTFKFRSLAAKIRLAFFETIPGYSVKDVKFYASSDATATTHEDNNNQVENGPTLFVTGTEAVLPSGSGTMTVSFPTTGWSNRDATDYNKAHITFGATSTSDLSKTLVLEDLDDFAGSEKMEDADDYLGRASNIATYAGGIDAETNAGKYFTILPYETGTNLMLRIKYTLVSTDGSDEEITVDKATAVIPAELAKWSPNYAYTYIFKISDLTNGSTGVDGSGNVAYGLTPITLNAVVVDSEDGIQETITTVSNPSITTYMAGKVVTENDQYTAGKPIYVIVNNGTANVELTATNAKLYTATVEADALQGITEETVDNALRYGVIATSGTPSVTTYTVTDAAGKKLVLTDVTPDPDGADNTTTDDDWLVKKILAADSPTGNEIVLSTTNNQAAKFSPTASTTYVFQYKGNNAGTYGTYTAVEPAKLATSGTDYYTYNTSTQKYDPYTVSGDVYIVSGTTYYTMGEPTYTPVSTLTTGEKYYYKDNGNWVEYTALASDNPVRPGGYYTKKDNFIPVPYKKLPAGTYYTSSRGAGKFTVTANDEVFVDAANKYFTETTQEVDGNYEYKIIKVQ